MFDTGIIPDAGDILEYWKSRQSCWPVLTQMARDFLSVASSGVGVERLFNSSRDVCHYRRARLNPSTVRVIMIVMCTTQFNLSQDYANLEPDVLDDLPNTAEDTEISEVPNYISDKEDSMDLDDEVDGMDMAPMDSVDSDVNDDGMLPSCISTVGRGDSSSHDTSWRSGRTAHHEGQYKT